MTSFEQKLLTFKSEKMWDEDDYASNIVKMSKFANEKYQHYQSIWIEYDDLAFLVALVVGSWTVIFNLATNFSGTKI